MARKTTKLAPPTPGEILRTHYLEPMGLTQQELSRKTGVHAMHISRIINGKQSITAATAIRFAAHFGTTDRYWLNLQSDYDLRIAHDEMGGVEYDESTETRAYRAEVARAHREGNVKRRPTAGKKTLRKTILRRKQTAKKGVSVKSYRHTKSTTRRAQGSAKS